jgi:hypothetical protein
MQPHDPWRDMRKVERDEVDFNATLRRLKGRPMDAHVVNLSTHGFMIRIDGEFEQGEQILVDLPVVGETMAKVAWALGGRIGGQFFIPIQPGRYTELLVAAAARPRLRWPA